MVLRYTLRLIPPVMKESVIKTIGNIKFRYLNKFMNTIIQKKILRNTPLLFEFLSLESKKFKSYQEKITQMKYELDIKLNN